MNNRRSIRLKGFDYSQKGYYFVTIAVKNKWKLFWNIVGADSYIRPNEMGLMIEKSILEIPKFYPGILINEYVVMPDHIHLIIKIDGSTISLSEIIQRFKILSTNRYIDGVKNHNWPRFNKRLWQRDYYEEIIRNENELEIVKKYIRDNPKKL